MGAAVENLERQAVPFTLNVRLTRRCNADCSYCCSATHGSGAAELTEQTFRQLLDYVIATWIRLRVVPDFVTVQYIGGESLTMKPGKLAGIVETGRQFFRARRIAMRDGIQSNLIGSRARVEQLVSLFHGRVGTSVDHFSSQRRLKGSADKYRTIFLARHDDVRVAKRRLPAVFVLDKEGVSTVLAELACADAADYDLTLRPVYEGARGVLPAASDALEKALISAFQAWFLLGRVVVEPFFGLVRRRLASHGSRNEHLPLSGCHFQSDCAVRSLHLDPNGDVFVCMEFADMQRNRLGNAITGTWEGGEWTALAARERLIENDCGRCTYYKECRGGCMAESVAAGGGLYDRTYLCGAWLQIFPAIDKAVEDLGFSAVYGWLRGLERA